MPLTGKKAGGGVHPHPTGSRQVHLGPGVQIRKIGGRSRWTVQGFDIRGQLDQITGYKPGGQTELSQNIDHQPGRVAARAAAQGQGLLATLDIGFQADEIADVLVELLVQTDQKIDGRFGRAVNVGHVGGQFLTGPFTNTVRGQVGFQIIVIGEREKVCLGFEEKVKRIDDDHFSHQIHLDNETIGFFRKDQTTQIVGERVLLPVDKVVCRGHLHAVA